MTESNSHYNIARVKHRYGLRGEISIIELKENNIVEEKQSTEVALLPCG